MEISQNFVAFSEYMNFKYMLQHVKRLIFLKPTTSISKINHSKFRMFTNHNLSLIQNNFSINFCPVIVFNSRPLLNWISLKNCEKIPWKISSKTLCRVKMAYLPWYILCNHFTLSFTLDVISRCKHQKIDKTAAAAHSVLEQI